MQTSTCSLDQLSMVKDLTLEMWVPSFRWIVAHGMQRKTPSCCACKLSYRQRIGGVGKRRSVS